MDAVLVRVGGPRVEPGVVDAAVGEDPVDGVVGETRHVPAAEGRAELECVSIDASFWTYALDS